MPIHRRGAEDAEEAQRYNQGLGYSLRSLCVLCASAVNEIFLTSSLKIAQEPFMSPDFKMCFDFRLKIDIFVNFA
jgi:hypothetical protein